VPVPVPAPISVSPPAGAQDPSPCLQQWHHESAKTTCQLNGSSQFWDSLYNGCKSGTTWTNTWHFDGLSVHKIGQQK